MKIIKSPFCFLFIVFVMACISPDSSKQAIQLQSEYVFVPNSLFTPTGHAQLDSLLQLEAVTKRDTNLLNLYGQIANLYSHHDSERGKEYLLKYKNLNEQVDWNVGRYYFACAFSNLLSMEGLTDSAFVILLPALELAKKENNELWIVNLCINTGDVYFNKEWYETALSYYFGV